VVQPGGELFDLGGPAVGPDATEDEQGARTGVCEEEISVGCGADEARRCEGATLGALTC
jgi:hypothetical protein